LSRHAIQHSTSHRRTQPTHCCGPNASVQTQIRVKWRWNGRAPQRGSVAVGRKYVEWRCVHDQFEDSASSSQWCGTLIGSMPVCLLQSRPSGQDLVLLHEKQYCRVPVAFLVKRWYSWKMTGLTLELFNTFAIVYRAHVSNEQEVLVLLGRPARLIDGASELFETHQITNSIANKESSIP
jgi:hypothetical protein